VIRAVLLTLLLAACSSEPTIDVSALADRGHDLFFGPAGCAAACHKVGAEGDKVIGPNLGVGEGQDQPVIVRALSRRPRLRPIEYIVESIIDPDAVVTPGYVSGVMKPPDLPPISLCDDDLVAVATFLAMTGRAEDVRAAREFIPTARRQRAIRRAQHQADDLVSRTHFDRGDATRGAEVFQHLGCPTCHDNPEPALLAPTLAGIGMRLPPPDLARRVVSPSRTGMPSYGDCLRTDDLAALCSYLAGK
jgi:cytochrome c2